MIVPWHDPDESLLVHDFASPPGFYSGGPSGLGDAPKESLVNPRRVGFVRDEFYIPVYWESE